MIFFSFCWITICSSALWCLVVFKKCWHHCDITRFLCKRLLGLMIICQGLPFQCDYLKDIKYPFESKCEIILLRHFDVHMVAGSVTFLLKEAKMILNQRWLCCHLTSIWHSCVHWQVPRHFLQDLLLHLCSLLLLIEFFLGPGKAELKRE